MARPVYGLPKCNFALSVIALCERIFQAQPVFERQHPTLTFKMLSKNFTAENSARL